MDAVDRFRAIERKILDGGIGPEDIVEMQFTDFAFWLWWQTRMAIDQSSAGGFDA